MQYNSFLKACLYAILLFVFCSCDQTRVFEEWKELDGVAWSVDSTLTYTFDVEDTTSVCHLLLGVRNTNTYPYRNIWLMAEIQGPNNIMFRDTVQLHLANNIGEWYGKRSASIYTYMMPLYSQLRFFNQGEYTVQLQHGMRADPLVGISSVGFRVEKELE